MAKYRQLQTEFWTDDFVQEMTVEQAYFYACIMAGKIVNQCGVFQFTYSELALHAKTTMEKIRSELLPFFIRNKKIIVYDNEIAVLNFHRHNNISTGRPVIDAIKSSAAGVKNKRLLWAVAQFAVNPQVKELLLNISPKPDESWDESWYESWDESWDGSWYDSSTTRFAKKEKTGDGGGGQNGVRKNKICNQLTSNHLDESSTSRGLEEEEEEESNTLSKPLNPLSPDSEKKSDDNSVTIDESDLEPEAVTNQSGVEKNVAPPPILESGGLRLVQKSLTIGGNAPSCLSIWLDDSFLAKEILSLLNGSIETMLMFGDLYKRPSGFLKFLLEYFVAEVMAKGEELTAGRLRLEFTNLVSYRLKTVEKKYNESQKTDKWFDEEFEKHVPKDWPESERQKFRMHYTSPLPSGGKHFQNVQNFVMKNAVETWAANNSVGKQNSRSFEGKKLGEKTKHIVAHGGMTIDQLEKHYGLQ